MGVSRMHFPFPKARNMHNQVPLACTSLLAPMFFRQPNPSWPLLDVKRESEVGLARQFVHDNFVTFASSIMWTCFERRQNGASKSSRTKIQCPPC